VSRRGRIADLVVRTVCAGLRRRAARRIRSGLAPGATVVVVTWNSAPFLEVCLRAVERYGSLPVVVIDNHSSDDPGAVIAGRPGVRLVRLPLNLGHGRALDIGVLLARTEHVVVLDVDAFPIRASWLEVLLQPLSEGAHVVGGETCRPYAHPSCLAMRLDRIVERRHSFMARYPGELGRTGWDVGELVSMREPGAVCILPATSVRGPGTVGTVFADVVYHNFYATRHQAESDPATAELDGGIRQHDASTAWADAVARYLDTTTEP
jgi:glycosyltransferase involved in cell wall biosynthesis